MNGQDLVEVKKMVEEQSGQYVRGIIADKPGWLLLKTSDRYKTIGCVRINKNSFVTLYIDTKEGFLLEEILKDVPGFESIDIKSRPTGNFVQNKIKLYNKDQAQLIILAINKVFEDAIVKTEKRVRNNVKNMAIA